MLAIYFLWYGNYGMRSFGANKKNRIKVMFVIDHILGIRGGTETQLSMLINNLNKDKYDITLLCLRKTRWVAENSSTLNCKVKYFNVKKLVSPKIIISFLRIIRYIKSIKPDILMTFFPESNIIGVYMAKLAQVKIIISARRDYGLWLDKKTYYFLRLANRFVKGVVTNSINVKKLTNIEEKFDNSKIHVIYNGIEVEKFHSLVKKDSLRKKIGISPQNKVVGIVANLNPMKRHKTFLNAAMQVMQIRSDVEFVIVGDGPLRRELESLANELDINEQVHFVGSQEDALPFLSIFDIGVNCSANEGLSNAIMEYMTFGIPCIVARAGGNEELIENGINGYTFDLDNNRELAEYTLQLLDDKKIQKKFAAKSKDKIFNQMNVKRMISDYDEYFTQLLANN